MKICNECWIPRCYKVKQRVVCKLHSDCFQKFGLRCRPLVLEQCTKKKSHFLLIRMTVILWGKKNEETKAAVCRISIGWEFKKKKKDKPPTMLQRYKPQSQDLNKLSCEWKSHIHQCVPCKHICGYVPRKHCKNSVINCSSVICAVTERQSAVF